MNAQTGAAGAFCPIDSIERNAYNAAFLELGLRFRWGNETLARLQAIDDERERVRVYLNESQAHLLRSYEAEFLIDAILRAKGAELARLEREGVAPAADGHDVRHHSRHEDHTHEIGF